MKKFMILNLFFIIYRINKKLPPPGKQSRRRESDFRGATPFYRHFTMPAFLSTINTPHYNGYVRCSLNLSGLGAKLKSLFSRSFNPPSQLTGFSAL